MKRLTTFRCACFSVVIAIASFAQLLPAGEPSANDHELIQHAFTDPLISGEQIHPPIATIDELYAANQLMYLPVEAFFDAYENIEIVAAEPMTIDDGQTTLLKLTYHLADRTFDAYAYTKLVSGGSTKAALLIPGSAFNLASGMYEENPKSNQVGIVKAVGDRADRYIFIKPNEDCLAIHNGEKKLNTNFFVNWHLENGGSYSAHYIASTLAFSKYLNNKYDKLLVAGLSQGGGAAILNILQSRPDVAVIASGFSIINQKALWSGHNQIIIPGVGKYWSYETIRDEIQKMPTQFLFSYGEQEVGTYRIEVTDHLTQKFLAPCKNVAFHVHSGGHEYATEASRKFLEVEF